MKGIAVKHEYGDLYLHIHPVQLNEFLTSPDVRKNRRGWCRLKLVPLSESAISSHSVQAARCETLRQEKKYAPPSHSIEPADPTEPPQDYRNREMKIDGPQNYK